MARTIKRYELTYQEELVIVAYIKGKISGSSAARRLHLDHRQRFVNMFSSVVQQWHEEGRLSVLFNQPRINKK